MKRKPSDVSLASLSAAGGAAGSTVSRQSQGGFAAGLHGAVQVPGVGLRPRPGLQEWAPAWFYSALGWLGKAYYDANNAEQRFGWFLAGSDVDPYAGIGATRLFVILSLREGYWLSIAPDADSSALPEERTVYPATDEGIRDMYLALAASPVFADVKYCYVPGRIGSDLDPHQGEGIEEGYQTALFAGGPGHDDAAATDLALRTTSAAAAPDHWFFTYTYDTAKAYATAELGGTRVELGVAELTCTAARAVGGIRRPAVHRLLPG